MTTKTFAPLGLLVLSACALLPLLVPVLPDASSHPAPPPIVSSPSPSPSPSPVSEPSPSLEPPPSPTPSPSPSIEPTPSPSPAPPPIPAKLIGVERFPCPPGFRIVEGACLAESSCEEPGENSKCFRNKPNGESVPWESDEQSCWSYPDVTATEFHFGHRKIISFGDAAMLCDPGYPDSEDDAKRGCSDAYGRRVKWNGFDWFEISLEDQGRNWSGWWFGYCPPRVAVQPSPSPSVGCSSKPECGGPESTGNPPGSRRYGCCDESEIRQLFRAAVELAQDELEKTQPSLVRNGLVLVDDLVYTSALAKLLTEKYGVCAKAGGPEDEVGVKNQDGFSEQYDVITSQHKTWANQTVTCRPSRF